MRNIPIHAFRSRRESNMKTHWTMVTCIFLFGSGVASASDQVPAKNQDHPIALVGATIHPVVGQVMEGGSILFDKGKIVAVGRPATFPQGTEVIDVKGKHIYPGLISGDTFLGLVEISAVRASRDRTETGQINPNVRAEAAVNPETELIPVTRANGITMFVSSPSGGLISGTSAVIMSDG